MIACDHSARETRTVNQQGVMDRAWSDSLCNQYVTENISLCNYSYFTNRVG